MLIVRIQSINLIKICHHFKSYSQRMNLKICTLPNPKDIYQYDLVKTNSEFTDKRLKWTGIRLSQSKLDINILQNSSNIGIFLLWPMLHLIQLSCNNCIIINQNLSTKYNNALSCCTCGNIHKAYLLLGLALVYQNYI